MKPKGVNIVFIVVFSYNRASSCIVSIFEQLGNLPGSTRILAAQEQHAKAMQENFSPEENKVYGEYFDLFQKHLQTNFSPTNLNQVMHFFSNKKDADILPFHYLYKRISR